MKIKKAFLCAFPYTVPIFAGFLFLGLTYGIYMHVSGFSFWYPMLMSLTIYGGSLEFVAVSMLLAPYAPIQTLIMSVMIRRGICSTVSPCWINSGDWAGRSPI